MRNERLFLACALMLSLSSAMANEPPVLGPMTVNLQSSKAELIKKRDAVIEQERIALAEIAKRRLPKAIKELDEGLAYSANRGSKPIRTDLWFEDDDVNVVYDVKKHYEAEGWHVSTISDTTFGDPTVHLFISE